MTTSPSKLRKRVSRYAEWLKARRTKEQDVCTDHVTVQWWMMEEFKTIEAGRFKCWSESVSSLPCCLGIRWVKVSKEERVRAGLATNKSTTHLSGLSLLSLFFPTLSNYLHQQYRNRSYSNMSWFGSHCIYRDTPTNEQLFIKGDYR